MTDYSELKRLAEAATPGPWKAQHPNAGQRGSEVADSSGLNQICGDMWPTHALYIAAANPSVVLALIAERDHLKAENEALQKSYTEAWEKARALQSECDEFVKDAERYRWLRDKAGAADWEYVGYQSPETTDGEIDQWMKERPNG